MTPTDLFIVLGALSLIIIAVTLVPTLFQIRRTYKKAEEFLDALNKEMGPLCKSLTETTSELEILAVALNDKMERTDKIFATVQQSADTLLLTGNMIRETVRPLVANIGGITAGVKTFTHFFMKSKNEP